MSLVSRWTLDNTPNDLNGSNNGTVSGTVEYSNSRVVGSSCMKCDGGADYINTGNWHFESYTNYSISVWFKCLVNASGTIFGQCTSGNNLNRVAIGVDSNGNFFYYYITGSVLFLDYSTLLYDDNLWHHAVILDTNGTVGCYIDGVIDTALAGTYARASVSSNNVLIGAINIADPSYWTGLIDDVRFYNHALSQAEVSQIYLDRIPRWQTPISRWMLENDATDLYNVHNGTASNMTYSTDSKSKGLSGSFNGTNGYVDLGNVSSLVPATITISAWVKLTGSGAYIVYDKDGDGANRGFYVQILNGYIDVTCGGNLPITRSGRTNLVNDGNWHHIVACGSASITWKTYIDGKLDMTGSAMAPVNATTVSGSIGKGSYPGIPNYFNGLMDDVRLYDVALTADEVLALYRSYETPKWDQPLHRWKLDGNALDSAGTRNGTAVGTITYSSGSVQGLCFTNTGGENWFDLGNFKSEIYTNYTITGWAKVVASGTNKAFVYCQNSAGSTSAYKQFWVSNTGEVILQLSDNSTTYISATSTQTIFSDSKWHHLVYVDANGTYLVYIDGRPCSISGSYTRFSMNTDKASICASSASGAGANRLTYGSIDDVRFYDIALSAAEVKSLYNSYFTEKAASMMELLG